MRFPKLPSPLLLLLCDLRPAACSGVEIDNLGGARRPRRRRKTGQGGSQGGRARRTGGAAPLLQARRGPATCHGGRRATPPQEERRSPERSLPAFRDRNAWEIARELARRPSLPGVWRARAISPTCGDPFPSGCRISTGARRRVGVVGLVDGCGVVVVLVVGVVVVVVVSFSLVALSL